MPLPSQQATIFLILPRTDDVNIHSSDASTALHRLGHHKFGRTLRVVDAQLQAATPSINRGANLRLESFLWKTAGEYLCRSTKIIWYVKRWWGYIRIGIASYGFY